VQADDGSAPNERFVAAEADRERIRCDARSEWVAMREANGLRCAKRMGCDARSEWVAMREANDYRRWFNRQKEGR
jgi:hypothetical protein